MMIFEILILNKQKNCVSKLTSLASKSLALKTVPKVPKATNAPFSECSIEDNPGAATQFWRGN